jgi:1,4-dihydroxy-2-naphthoate octaprenyltransferase
MSLKTWLLESRPQFLILSVILAFLGVSMAWFDGYFNPVTAVLAGIGLVLTHAAVNIINDYFDFRSGIDLKVNRTPFSGGSGLLPAKKMTPAQVLWLGLGCLLVAAAIGVYFVITVGWQLLPLLVVAGLCIILYSPIILKTPSPEWAAGLGLGVLPILGTYFVQTGFYSWHAVLASIPSGILVYNLLLLNEFPDIEADKTGNRKTLPITAGPQKAGFVYSAMMVIMYVWIAGLWIARGLIDGNWINGTVPVFTLISLLTLPLALKAIKAAAHPTDMSKVVPGMASNVMVVMGTQLLLGVGYIIGKVV